MNEVEFYKKLAQSVIDGDPEVAEELAQQGLALGLDPLSCIEHGLTNGIQEVGKLFESGEYFLPDLMLGGEAMKAAMEVFKPAMFGMPDRNILGRVVLATVKGDLHEIGKNLVGTMLVAHGFEVIDMGVDKSAYEIIDMAVKKNADLIGASSLLTTTITQQEKIVKLLDDEGLRSKIKIMIGGAPVTQNYADSIGADGFAPNAISAVKLARRLIGVRES